MTAPVCPISRSQPTAAAPPARQPSIPIATDLPSLIRAVNIMNDIIRNITTSLVVNNTRDVNIGADGVAYDVPPITDNNYKTSNYPEWAQISAATNTGFVFNKGGSPSPDKTQRAYISRINTVQYQNDQSNTDGPFTWSYSHPPDSPSGDSKGQPPFQEDFFERVINVHWENEPPVYWMLGSGAWSVTNGILPSITAHVFTSSDGKHWTSARATGFPGGDVENTMGMFASGAWMREGLAQGAPPVWVLVGGNSTTNMSSAAAYSRDGKTLASDISVFDNLHYAYGIASGSGGGGGGGGGSGGSEGGSEPPASGGGDGTPSPAGAMALDGGSSGGASGSWEDPPTPSGGGTPGSPPEPPPSSKPSGGIHCISAATVPFKAFTIQDPFNSNDGQSWQPSHYYAFSPDGDYPDADQGFGGGVGGFQVDAQAAQSDTPDLTVHFRRALPPVVTPLSSSQDNAKSTVFIPGGISASGRVRKGKYAGSVLNISIDPFHFPATGGDHGDATLKVTDSTTGEVNTVSTGVKTSMAIGYGYYVFVVSGTTGAFDRAKGAENSALAWSEDGLNWNTLDLGPYNRITALAVGPRPSADDTSPGGGGGQAPTSPDSGSKPGTPTTPAGGPEPPPLVA